MWLARALLSIYQHFVFTCVSLIGFGAHVEKVLEISSLGFRSPSPGVWFIERMPAVSRLVEGQWRKGGGFKEVFFGSGGVLFLNLCAGYPSVVSLCKFIDLSIYGLPWWLSQ